MFILLLGIYFPSNIIQFAQMQKGDIFMSIILVRSISKFIVDMYMFPLFLYHLMYFTFREKLEIYKQTKGLQNGFTIRHYLIITMITINWLLKFLHALANIFILLMRRYSLLYESKPSETINVLYLFSLRTYSYFVDFLNMMALLYLFVCQAQLGRDKKTEEESISRMTDIIT